MQYKCRPIFCQKFVSSARSLVQFSFFKRKSRKRIRQGLSQAQTLKAGLLYDTAMSKQDEDILLQIRDKDCVATVMYHKQCYSRYTKNYANSLKKDKVAFVDDTAIDTADTSEAYSEAY